MNQTKLEQKLRRENEMLAKQNGDLKKLVAATFQILNTMEDKFKSERFNRRLFMYGFYAVAILNIISSLCYFL